MKNYMEVASYGRGAGSDKPYTVAFEVSIRNTDESEGIRTLSTKSGLAVKKINSGSKPMSGFISLADLNSVLLRLKVAEDKLMEAETNVAVSSEAGGAETEYVFKMGNFKGKTPSQLLLEGTSKADLLAQRDFLQKNASGKFAAANQKGMADIDKAIAALDAGKLKEFAESTAKAPKAITLYKSGPRYFPKKQAQPYTTEGWELTLQATPGNKNPFSIEWQSKTVTIEKNMITAAKDVKVESAALTESEFVDAMQAAEEIIRNAEMVQIKKRLDYYEKHKDDYKNK